MSALNPENALSPETPTKNLSPPRRTPEKEICPALVREEAFRAEDPNQEKNIEYELNQKKRHHASLDECWWKR